LLGKLFKKIKSFFINCFEFSITRDNASSNDTLLSAFTKHYYKEGIRFYKDVPCIAYILNLVIQDIIKTLIKNNYNISYAKDIYNEEKEENITEEEINAISTKLYYKLYFKIIINNFY
jgi:hypothetical protein